MKNKHQHQFTIIELLLKYKEARAYTKLKDLDFISFKLFKLERTLSQEIQQAAENSMYLKLDIDEQQAPDQYAKDIQKQFMRLQESEYMKKIEYFIFGALSAYRNHHYDEALNFVS